MDQVSLTLRPARTEECTELTALCLRSKAVVHGYDQAFMAACETELAVTPELLARGGHLVAEVAALPVGFAQVFEDNGAMWLWSLFVEPDWIGKGVGQALFKAAMGIARDVGASFVVIDSDPGAEAFYLAQGACRVGETPSGSIPGRTLPRLHFAL